jgi:hypothetical protein
MYCPNKGADCMFPDVAVETDGRRIYTAGNADRLTADCQNAAEVTGELVLFGCPLVVAALQATYGNREGTEV